MIRKQVEKILREPTGKEQVGRLVSVLLELQREHADSSEKRPVVVKIKDIDTNETVYMASVTTGLTKSSLHYYINKLIDAYKEADEVYTDEGLKELLKLAFGDDIDFALADVVVYY